MLARHRGEHHQLDQRLALHEPAAGLRHRETDTVGRNFGIQDHVSRSAMGMLTGRQTQKPDSLSSDLTLFRRGYVWLSLDYHEYQ